MRRPSSGPGRSPDPRDRFADPLSRPSRVWFATLVAAIVCLSPWHAAATDTPSASSISSATAGRWITFDRFRAPDAAAVYDPIADRVVTFGGLDGAHYVNRTVVMQLGDSPPHWQELRIHRAPSPRKYHSAIYDPLGHRMVIFGGIGAVPGQAAVELDDVWVLPFGGVPVWRRLLPAGAGPAPQHRHAAVYDSRRRRMLVIDVEMRVWSLSFGAASRWTEIAVTGVSRPEARRGHSAMYDPIRDRVIVFGGTLAGDLWELRLGGWPEWSAIAVSGIRPPGQSDHRAIYDPVGDRMIVYGGQLSGADLWALSLGPDPHWTSLISGGATPTRLKGRWVVYDGRRGRMIVSSADNRGRVGALALDLAGLSWTRFEYDLPASRSRHAAVLDPTRNRMVVVGGFTRVPDEAGAVWSLDLETTKWTRLPVQVPTSRDGIGGIYDPVRDRMVFFIAGGFMFELTFDPTPQWRYLSLAGPEVLGGAFAYDPLRRRVLLFGGTNRNAEYLRSLWSYSLESDQWILLEPINESQLIALTESSMAYDSLRDRLVVFGGRSGSGTNTGETYVLPLSGALFWYQLNPSGPKPVSSAHATVLDPLQDRILTYGDFSTPNIHELGLAPGGAWRLVGTEGSPTGTRRSYYGAIFDPARYSYVFFSGETGAEANDTWILELDRPATQVTIDIRPGDAGNTIALGSPRLVSVAILSTDDFDATTLDATTVTFAGAPIVWSQGRLLFDLEDVDRDGRTDGVAKFESGALELNRGHTIATIRGRTAANAPFEGSQTVRVNPPHQASPETAEASTPATLALRVFPNPAPGGRTRVSLAIPGTATARTRIEMLDVAGRRVWTRDLAGWSAGEHEIAIEPERTLPAGVYWLRISSGARSATQRIAIVD